MRKFLAAAATIAVLCSAAAPASAVDFVGDYSVTYNTTDPGLVIGVSEIATSLNFSLLNEGDSVVVPLFQIFTNESAVNSDDMVAKPITVAFTFTNPAFMGGVGGSTNGHKDPFKLLGFIPANTQYGSVTWTGPQTLAFGNGGQLSVSLNNATFNQGVFGTCTILCEGADISATFTLTAGVVPEPATWAMMIGGFGAAGAALRRRRPALA